MSNDVTNILNRKYTEYELDKMRHHYLVFRDAVVSGVVPVDRGVSDWMNDMDELLAAKTKVYAVIEEYDPYVNYPDIESRAELNIHGIFNSLEKALAVRNDLARNEAIEYDVEIDESAYENPDRPIVVLGSEFYIREYEVE